ncbi:anaphase-promoting complex subunit 1 [Nematolebias whitei]|uniref:anaphase-promoting complex subunit 1 n=1 Tax=Nematolebias whitei TaxID=451745 RepID=UPI001896BEB0|nr:anaphase-promoting complex subunit 1 [Nematolebias whitei]
MSEVVYEETATMIAAGELQSFVPFGREHCRNHPNAFNLQLRELQPASELWSSDGAAGLVGSLQEVSLQERERECWQLRKGCMGVKEDEVEFEELYTSGNMVVWSQGSRTQASTVYKAFTVDSPVQQALWCNFVIPRNNNDEEDVEQTVCIVQSSCINVHTVTGKDFISPLPFQVSNVWVTKFGLLLERKNSANDTQLNLPGEPMPTVFSMLHPLDEIAPVVFKPSGLFEGSHVQYMSDSTMKIVFTCCQPSIVVSYDTVQGAHTVWALRKVTQDERSTVLQNLTDPVGTPLGLMSSSFPTSHLRNISHLDSPVGSGTTVIGFGSGSSCPPGSPLHYSALRSQHNRIMTSSPGVHSRVHSPSISSMAALSRAHSPGMAAPSFSGASRFNASFHSLSPKGHHGSLPLTNSTINETMPSPEMEPIVPDLCVEQLWRETVTAGCHKEMSSQASKVFITSDLCENCYLCFLVESHQQLRCVKFIESNDTSQLIFPSVTTIPAKDAAPLQNINAMLVLEACGSLVLYTGITRVSKVFVPGLLSPTFNLSNQLPHQCTPVENVSTPANAGNRHIQRLEDIMPSPVSELKGSNNKHHEASFFEDYTFQQATSFIHALRDPVCNQVTLELSSGTMLRISIPEIATSELVRKCLQAICFILPKEAAMKVLVKWYNIYNAPGGPSAHAEWSQFVTCFLTLMGYNTERLAWTRQLHFEVPLSPVIAAKKARHSDRGSDEDWDYLLASHYHHQIIFQPVCSSVESSDASDAVTTETGDLSSAASPSSSSLKLESSASLFPHIPALFYVLHLLYQELQLDELHRARASSLVCLLQQLARQNARNSKDKGHEMTSIGLLLGVSSAKLGTMDMSITRLLSIHIPALLPPTSTELDVPHNVQVAAVIGIGLVYQGTGHRHNAEVLLSEIGRPPGPEMEYCTDRESYSLAAGLALGMVCLGHGSNLIGMTDLNVPEQLYQYMVGGHRRAQAGANRERHKSPSYQIKEGDTINVDVTCPGATLAFAMIYLKTNNRSISDWLKPPDTWFLLDFIKPEFLLLRTLARCIIMWDEILPNTEWVKSNIPQIMRGNFDTSEDINMETMAQAQDYITAGACMALGLRFAGSANSDAFDCLYEFARNFMKMMSFAGTATVGAQMGYYNLQTGLSMILLAMSMVMAGTGNLKVLQLCRFFHKRTGGEMNYGFHMAHHMALGLLFLGGGRYTLSTSNSAIAALLCALYPHFPAHSTDNRYHLQALRHLAVLAAEPRLLVPVDVDSLKPCYALLEVTYKETRWYKETTVELMAPTLLPELHLLKQVKVKGPRYWELSLDLSKETQHLKSILSRDGVLYVKLRAGQLPYKDDPQGWKSLLTAFINHRNSGVTAFKPEAISNFTSEPALISFAEFFCKTPEAMKDRKDTFVLFSAMLYECVMQECSEMLPTYIAIEQAVSALQRGDLQQTFPLWQLRLVVELWDSRMLRGPANSHDTLLTSEFLPVMKNAVDVALDSWLKENSLVVRSYMKNEVPPKDSRLMMLACFLVYRSIPCLKHKHTQLEGCSSFGDVLLLSNQLGIPLRDLLRLVPVLLSSVSESPSLLGFPLQAFSS